MKHIIQTLFMLFSTLLMTAGNSVSAEDRFDVNKDSYLDQNEFSDFSFNAIDRNKDNRLDSAEWDGYVNDWYDAYDLSYAGDEFSEYDKNNDSYIDDDEYDLAFDRSLFDAWDTDSNDLIDDAEYEEATAFDDADEKGWFDF